MKKKLLLVDGSSYLYRAFYAMPDMRVTAGDRSSAPTGALHGMVNMLESLQKNEPAVYAACIFDAPGPTFRNEWYEDYKAHRPPMPDDLRAQIELIHEAVRLMGWPLLQVPGVEADDVIGTLARVASDAGFEVVISTGDKDMAQLVNEHVRLVNTMAGESLDVQGVTEKYGVAPDKIIDYLTLMGDTSDNVPGVEKVGPKTAVKWIQEYGSLQGVVAAAPNMKGAAGERLREALDWLPQAKRLVTIVTDCDLTPAVEGYPKLEALKKHDIDKQAFKDFLQQYGFRKRVKDLEQELLKGEVKSTQNLTGDLFAEQEDVGAEEAPQITPAREVVYENILTWEAFDACFAALKKTELVAMDTETTSLEP
ncbi:MAG: 5'-3' exonuclease, partial [Saezia sp.]